MKHSVKRYGDILFDFSRLYVGLWRCFICIIERWSIRIRFDDLSKDFSRRLLVIVTNFDFIHPKIKHDFTFFLSLGTSSVKSTTWTILKVLEINLIYILTDRIIHVRYSDNFQLTGWTAFILLVFYMAISNILLVNLLVAMFS